MSPRPSVSSTVVTSKPSIAACRALIGSTSVTMQRAPMPRSGCAHPLPTSPYPQITATLPATITSVARLIPSARDSLHPYKLSNFDFVTESFTLMAGTSSLPCSIILESRCTPVVVSSETPRQSLATFCQCRGSSAYTFFSKSLITCSSWFPAGPFTHGSPSSSSYPLWISSVTSPPSSTTSSGPLPPLCLSAWYVHHQYSSSDSPFQAKTGTPVAAIAATA